MRKLRSCALVSLLVAACGGGSDPEEQVQAPLVSVIGPDTLTYCCDPDEPPPEGGYSAGRVTFLNDGATECTVSAKESPLAALGPTSEDAEDKDFTLGYEGTIGFDIMVPACDQADQTVTFVFENEAGTIERTVTVKWDCPEEEPGVQVVDTCGDPDDEAFCIWDEPLETFADDTIEYATCGPGGATICELGGPPMRDLGPGQNFGCTRLPEVPATLSGAAVAAPEAVCFYGIGVVGVTSWDEANGIFGMYGVDGFGRNWTDVTASGDPNATDHFLAVDILNRRVASITPQNGFWALQTFTDVVAASRLDPAWGLPVAAFRPERTGDIYLALAPNPTTPGNLVLVSMGGDDVADSAQLLGQTGAFPRDVGGRNGIIAIACAGGNVLSVFRKTAGGHEKIGDEAVGNGSFSLDATWSSADDTVAVLTTSPTDDTWSVTIVDPATGTVVGTTTRPVPPGIDEPTDIQVNGAGDVYILGKASRNIAKIPGALE